MDDIFYPNKEQLKSWVNYLKNSNNALEISLPIINENWYSKTLITIENIKVPYIIGMSSKAAHLFYYLTKDHHFLDGNKRTGIAITYLFFLSNGYHVRSAERIRILAKDLAKSHGSRNKEYWIKKIEKEFSYVCTPVK